MMFLTLVVSLVVIGVSFFYYNMKKLSFFKDHEIPYVKPMPLVGNMGGLMSRRQSIYDMMKILYNSYPDAKYIGMYEFLRPLLLIRDPELIKSICVKNFEHFQDHRVLINDKSDPLFGKILTNLSGKEWKDQRNMLSPAFTSSKIKNMFVLMFECAKRFTDQLTRLPEKDRELEMRDLSRMYTNDVIATCVYGVVVNTLDDPKNPFYVYGTESCVFNTFKLTMKILLYRNLPWLADLLGIWIIAPHISKFFKRQIEEAMKARDESGVTRSDMIQLLMDCRKTLDMDSINTHAFTFYFGGFDSVSSQTTMVFQMFMENPDVVVRLQEEIDEALKNNNGQLSYEVINNMKYLDAVLNESLRLVPIAANMDRMCTKSFELPPALPGGKPFTVQPGTSVWFPAYALHTDPKYFDDPMKFDPNRFMDDGKRILNSGFYMPFGIGPRMCIGNRFAMMKMKAFICNLLARFDLKPCKKTVVPMNLSKGVFAVTPVDGVWLKLEHRKNAHPSVQGLENGQTDVVSPS